MKNREYVTKKELKLTERTWRNLIKRKEFTKKFVNKRGKIYKK